MNPLDESLLAWFKCFPHHASFLGLSQYDSLYPELSLAWMEKCVDELNSSLANLEDWEDEALEIDASEAVRSLRSSLLEFAFWKPWKGYPIAPSVITELILTVLLRKDLPEPHKSEALAKRIKAIPEILENSKELLERPRELWVRLALAELEGLKLTLLELSVPQEVLAKLVEYEKWLEGLEPDEGFEPMGEPLFRELLGVRGIRMGIESLESLARKKAEELREELGERPSGKAVEDPKEAYAESVKRAREFVVEKRLAPLSPDEQLSIEETPKPLVPTIPFAAYNPPSPFSFLNMGYLFVTPKASKKDYYEILNTAVHETYPGHHLQLSLKLPTKYRYVVANATDLVEGWAHYSEWLMYENGFDDHPRYRWEVMKDSLWRWVRVYLDIGLSTGKLSFREAVEELTEVVGMDEEAAKAEAIRYTLTPGYQLSYAYGKMRILEMREKFKEYLGSKFDLYSFHEALLSEGALPVDVLEGIVAKKLNV